MEERGGWWLEALSNSGKERVDPSCETERKPVFYNLQKNNGENSQIAAQLGYTARRLRFRAIQPR